MHRMPVDKSGASLKGRRLSNDHLAPQGRWHVRDVPLVLSVVMILKVVGVVAS